MKKILLLTIMVITISILTGNGDTYAATNLKEKSPTMPTQVLAPIVVKVGAPALWRVSNGRHTLWIITRIPYIKDSSQWNDYPIKTILKHAQAFISLPNLKATRGFTWLWVKMSLEDACKIQNGGTLSSVLPKQLYARWRVLWRQYGDDDTSVNRLTPGCAALRLRTQFEKKNNFRGHPVQQELLAIANKGDLKIFSPGYIIYDTKNFVMAQIRKSNSNGLACFRATLNFVQSLHEMQQEYHAWAIGDVKELRKILNAKWRNGMADACDLSSSDEMRLGLSRVEQGFMDSWMKSVKLALKKYDVSVAVVHSFGMDPHGYRSALLKAGYRIKRN